MTRQMPASQRTRIRLTVSFLTGTIALMAGLVWASVPLYQLFCQVTGFAGTTQVAEQEAEEILDRVMKVRFNADVVSGLPWEFRPTQREVELRVGETGMAYYTVVNNSSRPIVGTASYNVTPLKAGPYFSKIDCFCFTEQELAPGEEAELPITFFVDPEIADDKNLNEVKTITLSYTFFEKRQGKARSGGQENGLGGALQVASLDNFHIIRPGGIHTMSNENKLGD